VAGLITSQVCDVAVFRVGEFAGGYIAASANRVVCWQ